MPSLYQMLSGGMTAEEHREKSMLSVAKKRISSSFEDGNNHINALSGVIFLVISIIGIIW